MSRFHAYTRLARPGLHLWREGTSVRLFLSPRNGAVGPGWVEFEYDFEPGVLERVRFMLFEFDALGSPGVFESDAHQRQLVCAADGTFPESVWFAEGAARVLTADPLASQCDRLRVHLISQRRYRPGQLYLWDAATSIGRRVDAAGEDALGPIFELELAGLQRSLLTFKFIGRGENGQYSRFEPDEANRLWNSLDGDLVWTHSNTAGLTSTLPQKRTLRMHYRQQFEGAAQMRLWAESGDYAADISGSDEADGWCCFVAELYAGLPYGVLFWNPQLPDAWEHAEAKRQSLSLSDDTEYWTLEGDRHLFQRPPVADRRLHLKVVARADTWSTTGDLLAHVWVNQGRGPLLAQVPVDAHGEVTVDVYPEVTTSIKIHDGHGHWERIRHPLQIPADTTDLQRFIVLDRPPLLEVSPPANLFEDPPFSIRRPGAYAEAGCMHFVVHAPSAALVQVVGPWTDRPVPMHSTHDGTYWWARVPLGEIMQGQGYGAADYHGVRYQFLFNGTRRLQDPAAGWVEDTWNERASSRLVRSDAFTWHDQHWQRPGWEYLIVYQLHVSRFSNRFQDEPPLLRIAHEIDSQAGYLRDLGITAIQLLPVNEVGSTHSWGYDPAFFYAVEGSYCGAAGPHALKELVDTCHRHGLAVLLDVVFNHAGSIDNILWEIARESFFDGDTQWGAMINFDHPQCRHFFAQNLAYLSQEYHIDGFRLDHTATIVHSGAWDAWSTYVRELGSGGGWDFLHTLRQAVRSSAGEHCLLAAEHLPNEWSLTNAGGPMDTQWCDEFHDRLLDACRRQFGMSRLATALQLSEKACQRWYNVTNYPESHDEVGNVRDRVAYVAGWGQGLRMSKVSAAATLLSRGIPLFFMGAESGEDRQFTFGGSSTLDLDGYLSDGDRSRVRQWWRTLCWLHRHSAIQGPSPLEVRLAEQQTLAFTRGQRHDYFVLLNFGGWAGYRGASDLNLPEGTYRELWNSTWPAFAVRGENEDEHTNGGRERRLERHDWIHVPDYGAIVLERVD